MVYILERCKGYYTALSLQRMGSENPKKNASAGLEMSDWPHLPWAVAEPRLPSFTLDSPILAPNRKPNSNIIPFILTKDINNINNSEQPVPSRR